MYLLFTSIGYCNSLIRRQRFELFQGFTGFDWVLQSSIGLQYYGRRMLNEDMVIP